MSLKQIWVDADVSPKVIKEILFRVADRVNIPVTLVANQSLRVPGSPYIRSVQVAAGFGIADNHIAQQVEVGNLVNNCRYSISCRGNSQRLPGLEPTR